MVHKKEKLDISECMGKYEKNLVTNFGIRSKMPLEFQRTKIAQAFEKAADIFPKMTKTTFPKENEIGTDKERYLLREMPVSDPKRPIRTLSISRWNLAVATLHPLLGPEHENTIQSLAGVLDSLELVSPLLFDYADMKFVFEFDFLGNHHKKILGALFKGSCFDLVVNELSGIPTFFNPEIYIRHREDKSLRFITEIRPQTSVQEIESEKYEGDCIGAVCTVAKLGDFSPKDTLVGLFEQLERECLFVVNSSYLKNVVEPLANSLEDMEK